MSSEGHSPEGHSPEGHSPEGHSPEGVAFSRTLRAREDARDAMEKNPTPEKEAAYIEACAAHGEAKKAMYPAHWQD